MKRSDVFSELDMAKHYAQHFEHLYNKYHDKESLGTIADKAKLYWQGVYNPCNVRFILCNDYPYSLLVSFNDIEYELCFNICPNMDKPIQFNFARCND